MRYYNPKHIKDELAEHGISMEAEIEREWQHVKSDMLKEMLEDNSLEDLIDYYQEEALEFIECVPSISKAYMSIVIELMTMKIMRSHCYGKVRN